jgi:hypothetical protein
MDAKRIDVQAGNEKAEKIAYDFSSQVTFDPYR